MSSPPTNTREYIEQVLSENEFGYQNVNLPFGLGTGGVDRTQTAQAIFNDNVKGKSVFDLGCRFGFFCFHAEELGAASALGTDIDPENIRKSKILAGIRDSKARFDVFDIEKNSIEGRYDYVLCLNVLHHLRNPLSALEKLIAATREVLALELASFALRDRRNNHIPLPLAFLLDRLPLFLVARDSTHTFFITTQAIKVMLLQKRFDFARIDVVPAGPKGRPIVLAHKRRIKRLIVIAGLPASGKSTLIAHLQSDESSAMRKSLGFDNLSNWRVLQLKKLPKESDPDMGDVILHYNISQHQLDGDMFRHSNVLTDIINVAEEVTIISLVTPRQRLIKQFTQFRAYKADKLISSRRVKKKMKKLLGLLSSNDSLDELYGEWFTFVRQSTKTSHVVAHDGGSYSVIDATNLSNY